MTIEQKIRRMNEEELGRFIFMVYNHGWFDGRQGIDDENFFCGYMLNLDSSILDELDNDERFV